MVIYNAILFFYILRGDHCGEGDQAKGQWRRGSLLELVMGRMASPHVPVYVLMYHDARETS